MQEYMVEGGIAHVGPGQVMALTENQYKRRAHNVEVIKTGDKKKRYHVKALCALQFKVGEVIAFSELPKNLAMFVHPLGKPKSKADQVAAAASGKGSGDKKVRPKRKRSPAKKKPANEKAADPGPSSDGGGNPSDDSGAGTKPDDNQTNLV